MNSVLAQKITFLLFLPSFFPKTYSILTSVCNSEPPCFPIFAISPLYAIPFSGSSHDDPLSSILDVPRDATLATSPAPFDSNEPSSSSASNSASSTSYTTGQSNASYFPPTFPPTIKPALTAFS